MKMVWAAILMIMAQAKGQAACIEDAETPTATAMSMTGLWHISSSSCLGAHSGSSTFYFGRDAQCDYNDGTVKDAFLTTPLLNLTSAADAVLSFWTKWQVESVNPSCYDQLWLEREEAGGWVKMADLGPVSDPAGGSPSLGVASGSGIGGEPEWQLKVFDLSAYIGSAYRFRFRYLSGAYGLEGSCFNPADDSYDYFKGWAIDDISLGCPPAPMTLQKSASPSFAAPGAMVTFTIYAKNWDASARTLSVWDSLPAYANFVSASDGGALSGGLVSWTLGPLAPYATQAITLIAQIDPSAPTPSDWANTASGSSSAGGMAFESPAATVKVRPSGLVLKKSSSRTTLTSGDRVTFTMEVSNFTPSAVSNLDVVETYPPGFVELGVAPAYTGPRFWRVASLLAGETRYFTVWGIQNGLNNQTVANQVQAWTGPSLLATASVSLLIKRPEAPEMSIRSVYPNPAPSGKPGLPQSAFVYFETNQGLDLQLTVLSTAGDVVRRISFRGDRGKNQVEWDLKNDFGQEAASGVYVLRLWGSSDSGGVEAWAHLAVSR